MMFDSPSHPPASHYEYFHAHMQPDASSIKQAAFAMMDQLEGWCSHEKASFLIDLVLKIQPQTIVEIGVFGGKSLIPMAYAQKTLGIGKTYGIDPWDRNASIQGLQDPANKNWWGSLDHDWILHHLQTKMQIFKLENQVQLIRATSADAPPINEIDILHIDGNHSEETSSFDVLKWVPLVKSGGWIIFDDLQWQENGQNTTSRAVEWLNAHCLPFMQFKDTSIWGIWIKL